MGSQEYAFKATEETNTDLIRIPLSRQPEPAEEVAQIKQKLLLQVLFLLPNNNNNNVGMLLLSFPYRSKTFPDWPPMQLLGCDVLLGAHQRVLNDEERLRLRERGAEAERERKERQLTRLDQAPQQRKGVFACPLAASCLPCVSSQD